MTDDIQIRTAFDSARRIASFVDVATSKGGYLDDDKLAIMDGQPLLVGDLRALVEVRTEMTGEQVIAEVKRRIESRCLSADRDDVKTMHEFIRAIADQDNSESDQREIAVVMAALIGVKLA